MRRARVRWRVPVCGFVRNERTAFRRLQESDEEHIDCNIVSMRILWMSSGHLRLAEIDITLHLLH